MTFPNDPTPWADEAACKYTDPEAFFPPKGKVSHQAKQICAECPVRLPCLEFAMKHGRQVLGIWGGLSEAQRDRLRYRRSA